MAQGAAMHRHHAHTIMASPPFPSFSPKTLPQALNSTPHQKLPSSTATHRLNVSTKAELASKSAIQRITEKLRNLGFIDPAAELPGSHDDDGAGPGPGSPGEIFIPSPKSLPVPRIGRSLDSSWTTPDHPVPEPGSGRAFDPVRSARGKRERKPPAPLLAEIMIPEAELRRLRTAGIRLDKRLKVGKAGITEGIVNGIHERWRRSEVVKIKCEDLCRVDMKRTQEILERKTGGLVIWKSGSTIILYRGSNYVYPYFVHDKVPTGELIQDEVTTKPDMSFAREAINKDNSLPEAGGKDVESTPPFRLAGSSLVLGVGSPDKVRFQLPGELEVVEASDRLLDGLGPRFNDWWGYDPLPIDADLLPALIPGYRRPFRLLPYGIKPKLTDREMTILRRLSRPLPCHFALGRNRNLQGLAAAIVKLWEKCEIAKIAVKRGVQNTNSELMAEELKLLTGGTLLSRDREFIVFYRGKDFLPPAVSNAIKDRRKHMLYEEHKLESENIISPPHGAVESGVKHPELVSSTAVLDVKGPAGSKLDDEQRRLDLARSAMRRMDVRLSMAVEKKEEAERELVELESKIDSAEPILDREAVTEEERYMLRKLGLRMKAFCVLGRRGVFDGTIENMHLHWKYRELVKIISKDRCIEDVQRTARILEAESGGILVAVERVNKGYAIIVYRGKNYVRPDNLRPRTLLSKRQAMKRSIEEQRYSSLKLHVLKLGKNIEKIKDQMASERYAGLMHASKYGEIKPSTTEGKSNSSLDKSEASAAIDNVKDNMSRMIASDSEDFSETDGEGDASGNESGDGDSSSPDDARATLAFDNQRQFNSQVREDPSELVLGAASTLTDPEDNDLDARNIFRAAPLSNKERLLLRRQALLMKKRPVLAIGRNNVITGVANAILTHFKKKPLAIVNVKGRAKGTSIRELVFKLEQATGAVLVSQEPNKVILYRGWGANEEKPGSRSINSKAAKNAGNGGAVSPEVMAAIRFECGLADAEDAEGTLE
ncbi:CRM-domain containing factor CFM2, chloroplastic isoform X2 [Nymphaea colorata]|uniref:CRM-domain containing factor CFM2, chloroplastic isoform X2 n=1 Tax=Nymphaea colorata TaxID=210225 RepID=UPI00129E7BBC|nr:CRM-domain containing factor CFM2, chloroplastic isoform X2 [Nymphaea colorata]